MIRSTAILLGLGAAAFAQSPDFESASVAYDTGTSLETRMPWSMRQADLDGDGDLDVALVSGAAVPRFTVLRNRGDGAFEPPEHYVTASGFWDDVVDLDVADFDLDGDLDVAVTSTGNTGTGRGVAIHRNAGDGTFGSYQRFSSGPGPTGIVAADLNGDGYPDLATANYARIGQGTTVSILINDRTGGFHSPVDYTVGRSPYKITSGDLDGDGRIDLAVALDGHELVVLRNTGEVFVATSYDVLPNGWAGNVYPAVELADLDLDGDLDAVYTNTKTGFQPSTGRGAIGVLFNDGSGQLGRPVALSTLPEAQGGVEIAVADWNRDGWPDIATAHLHDGEWLLFYGDGNGGFVAPRAFQAGEYAIDIDAADINGDGLPDVLVLERHSLGLAVYKSSMAAELADPITYPMVSGVVVSRNVKAADVDGDGDLDLGVSYGGLASNSGGIGLIRNRGDGTFSPPQMLPSPVKALSLRFRDLNGDGLVDLLWADDFIPYQFHTRLNEGGGIFGPRADWNANGCKIGDIDAFDFDGDGDLDVAIGAAAACGGGNGQPLTLRVNLGNGTFGAMSTHTVSTFTSAVTHADVDNDGNQDLITNSGFNGIEVSLGNGDGTFQGPVTAFTGWGPSSIAMGDFDADGILDLATSNKGQDGSTVSVLRGFGDGAFWPPVDYLSAYDPSLSNAGAIVAGDADGDGDLDLMTGNWSSKDVTFLRNNGDGTFAPQIRYGAGDETFDLVWADFTGDGVEDLAVAVLPGLSLSFYPAVIVLRGTAGSTWRDLGFGLAGTNGVPRLSSATPFASGSTFVLQLQAARPSSPGVHIIGLERIDVPLLGGVLVPSPQLSVPFATTAGGGTSLTVPLVAGLPVGLTLFFQSWLLDPAGPTGLAASNALQGTHY